MTERVVRARVEPHPSRQSRSKLTNHQSASVAQLVEQRTENPRVVGSIPTGGTTYADLAHLVERHLAKVEVAGSSPVIRSKNKCRMGYILHLFFIQVADLVYHHATRLRGYHRRRRISSPKVYSLRLDDILARKRDILVFGRMICNFLRN